MYRRAVHINPNSNFLNFLMPSLHDALCGNYYTALLSICTCFSCCHPWLLNLLALNSSSVLQCTLPKCLMLLLGVLVNCHLPLVVQQLWMAEGAFPPKTAAVMAPVHRDAVRETQLHSKEFAIFGKKGQPGRGFSSRNGCCNAASAPQCCKWDYEAESISIFGNKPSTSPCCSSCCLLNIVNCHCIFTTKHHQGFSPQEMAAAILPLHCVAVKNLPPIWAVIAVVKHRWHYRAMPLPSLSLCMAVMSDHFAAAAC